jgi:hypothetical protein
VGVVERLVVHAEGGAVELAVLLHRHRLGRPQPHGLPYSNTTQTEREEGKVSWLETTRHLSQTRRGEGDSGLA